MALLDRYVDHSILQYISDHGPIAPNESSSPLSRLSEKCQGDLFDIAVLFHEIDLAVMQEIQLDREFYANYDENVDYGKEGRPQAMRIRTLFDEDCQNLEDFEQNLQNREIKGHSILESDVEVLRGAKFNNIWALSAVSLLVYQGAATEIFGAKNHNFSQPILPFQYIITKERARIILDLRSNVLDILEGTEDELLRQQLGYVRSGIRSRLRSLDGFEGVYNREVGKLKSETAYIRPSEKRQKRRLVPADYQQS